MRTLLFTVIAVLAAAQRAGADMVPEDPYTDRAPAPPATRSRLVRSGSRPQATSRAAPGRGSRTPAEAAPTATATHAATPTPATPTPVAPVAPAPSTAASAAPEPAAPITRLSPPQTSTADDTILALGSVTFESGPLPAPFDSDPRLAGFCAGYVCDVVGVAGTYFDIQDCRPAAIHGVVFDDATRPLVAAIQARYPAPAISFWQAQGWKLVVAGIGVLAFGWIVWRLRGTTAQRAARQHRRTMFQLSAVDPAAAAHHMAAWEPRPQPVSYAPARSPASSQYGPYGRVAATQRPTAMQPSYSAPCGSAAGTADPAPSAFREACPESAQPSASCPTPDQASPPHVAAVVDDFSKTTQDVSYQAYVEREHAIQLARGSQAEELERTRRCFVMQNAARLPEPAAIRATRLRHPPVPKPAQLTILSQLPNRLS